MTQELYQKAMKFAGEKHSDQKVPGTNSNYLLHISNVAMEVLIAHHFEGNFDLGFAIQIAILHDTIEDTSANYNEIMDSFGEPIAKAVKALSKDQNIVSKEARMIDSLKRINELQNEVGLVKLADRITNLQAPPLNWSKDKTIKYCDEAKLILKVLGMKNKYLSERLLLKIKDYEIRINRN